MIEYGYDNNSGNSKKNEIYHPGYVRSVIRELDIISTSTTSSSNNSISSPTIDANSSIGSKQSHDILPFASTAKNDELKLDDKSQAKNQNNANNKQVSLKNVDEKHQSQLKNNNENDDGYDDKLVDNSTTTTTTTSQQQNNDEEEEKEKKHEQLLKSVIDKIRQLTAPKLKETLNHLIQEHPDAVQLLDHVLNDHASALFQRESHEQHQIQNNMDIDWNEDFQQLLDAEDSESKFRRLYHLANDFVQTATTIGRIIISELCVPITRKLIKPLDASAANDTTVDWKGDFGLAGGQKFLVQNILFKFFVDVRIRDDYYMYGGKNPNDEAAMKVANHELKGLMHFYSCNIKQLRFPFIAVITYKGFKMEAVSRLPIDSSTIKYGSADSAKTIHADNDHLNKLMEAAAHQLNLQKHLVGKPPSAANLHCGGDVEVHLGRDNKFYMLDFHRTFPPEAPSDLLALRSAPKITTQTSRSVYFHFLRPELVRSHPNPLSSDAYTRWGSFDPLFEVHNDDVRKASVRLFEKTIPEFCAKLDALDSKPDSDIPLSDLLKDFRLIEEMHRCGINIRHLGLIRYYVTSRRLKKLVLNEILSRHIKNFLRKSLRETMRTIDNGFADEPFKSQILFCFNCVLCKDDRYQSFWHSLLKNINTKFSAALMENELELDPKTFVQKHVDTAYLFRKLLSICAVRLTAQAEKQLLENPSSFLFVDSDIEEIQAQTNHLNIVLYSEAKALLFSSYNKKSEPEKLRLQELAARRLEQALWKTPDNFLYLVEWGKVLFDWAVNLTSNYTQATSLLRSSCEKFKATTDINKHFAEGYILHGKALLQLLQLVCLHSQQPSTSPVLNSLTNSVYANSSDPELDLLLKQALDCFEYGMKISSKKALVVIDLARSFQQLAAEKRQRFFFRVAIEMAELVLKFAPNNLQGLVLHFLATFDTLHFEKDEIVFVRMIQSAELRLKHCLAISSSNEKVTLELVKMLWSRSNNYEEEAKKGNSTSFHFVISCLSLLFFVSRSMLEKANINIAVIYLRRGLAAFEASNTLTTNKQQLLTLASKSFDRALSTDKFVMDDIFSNAFETQKRQLADLLSIATISSVVQSMLFQCGPLLSKIDLSETDVTDADASHLATKASTYVRSLNLSGCMKITNRTLFKFASDCSNLEKLKVARCFGISEPGLISIFQNCPLLEVLDLSYLEDIHNSAIRELSLCCKYMRKLKANGCKNLTDVSLLHLSTLKYMHEVDLSGIPLHSEAFISFGQSNKALHRLRINEVSDVDTKMISTLASMCQFSDLEIRGNSKVTISAIKDLAETSREKLTFLNISGNIVLEDQALIELSDKCPNLRHLDVRECKKIGDDGFIAISKFKNLRYLSISDCARLSDLTFKRWQSLDFTFQHLTVFHLSNTTHSVISSESFVGLFKLLPNLKTGNFKGQSKFTDNAMDSIRAHCPLIEYLDVSGTSVLNLHANVTDPTSSPSSPHTQQTNVERTNSTNTNSPVIGLRTSGSLANFSFPLSVRFENLKAIRFAGCGSLKDSAIDFLRSMCPKLTMLDISGCSQISENALSSLFMKNKRFERLWIAGCTNSVTDHSISVLWKNNGTGCLKLLDISKCNQITWKGLRFVKRMFSLEVFAAQSLQIDGDWWTDITLYLYRLVCLDLAAVDPLKESDVTQILKHAQNLRAFSFRSCYKLSAAFVEKLMRTYAAATFGTSNWMADLADAKFFHGAQDFSSMKKNLLRLSTLYRPDLYQPWTQ